jgi:DNA-directed RNA polymerase specialized sigma24 family protein
MSPQSLRSYRAELLLRKEFKALRGTVLAGVRSRLRGAGVHLDERDVDACYSIAWHSLYAAQLEGAQIGNLAGWLELVTYRRALDEHRARERTHGHGRDAGELAALDRDLAAELDDRAQLRHLFEALTGRLVGRELQAAALCYLHGLSRAEAARALGVSEARMRKLMEGRGRGARGVAGKVTALLSTVSDGAWCEEQASLMRGLAYGLLDPAGERYKLALAHTGACPACRAYVASLRGLAAFVPPAPALLELVLAGAGGAKAAGGGAAGAASVGAGGGVSGGGAAGIAGGAAAPSAASGVAAGAGGGWLLAGGSVGAKLAAGCLLALGVGAGCAVLDVGRDMPPVHASAHRARRAVVRHPDRVLAAIGGPTNVSVASHPAAEVPAVPPASAGGRASLEFGPEQGRSARASAGSESGAPTPVTRPRAVASAARAGAEFAAGAAGAASPPEPAAQPPAVESRPGAAQREFSPG